MPRLVRIGLFVVAGGALATAAWLWLSSSTPPPAQQRVEGVSDTVHIGWRSDGLVTVDAATSDDALAALGYVHGVKRGWTLSLWRQTGLGRLSEWFGPGTISLDRHVLRLGLRRHARAAYEELPPEEKRHLRAYSRGLNAALQSDYVRRQDAFLLLELPPVRWKPWHALLIERLLAWTTTELRSVPPDAPPALDDFHRRDRQLRRLLHLHGWKQSVTWAVRGRDTSETSRPAALFQRHVLGATAVPLVQEVSLRAGDAPPLKAATLPGTLLFPTGTTEQHAWGVLLHSPARVERVPHDSQALTQWHERITPDGGNERLVSVRRLGDALPLLPQTSTGPGRDSTWVLRWPGFTSASDVPTWLGLSGLSSPASTPPSFRLFRGDGLSLSRAGDWRVWGRPSVVERQPSSGLIAVGNSTWTRYQAEGLRAQLDRGTFEVGRLSEHDSSTWGGALLQAYGPALDAISGSDSLAEEARSYLRNWNHRYEPRSIGASVFEHWMRAYRTAIGSRPSLPDTTYFAHVRRRRAFQQAVDTLSAQHGTDLRRWRWEEVAPDRRFFPLWSADSLVSRDLSGLRSTRYAPLDRPGRGHASTPTGGPSPSAPSQIAPSPTNWDGWMAPGDTSFTARRLRFDPDGFFARPLLPSERPAPASFSTSSLRETTILVPAAP